MVIKAAGRNVGFCLLLRQMEPKWMAPIHLFPTLSYGPAAVSASNPDPFRHRRMLSGVHCRA
jgi:hypothetical protein